MTSGILFDFNGVIVDDEPQHCDALIATLAGVRLHAGPGDLLSRLSRLRRPRVLPLHLRANGRAAGRGALARGDRAEAARYERSIRLDAAGARRRRLHRERGARWLSARHRLRRAPAARSSWCSSWPDCGPTSPRSSRRRTWAPASPIRRATTARARSWSSPPGAASWWRIRSRAGRGPRRRPSLRDARHLARRRTPSPRGDLVWRDFVGHDAAELPWAHV